MGCTHYPHARKAIKKAFGKKVRIFDGSMGTAREAMRRITVAGLLNNSDIPGEITYLCSDEKKERIRKLLEV